jgi:hypothetical protein
MLLPPKLLFMLWRNINCALPNVFLALKRCISVLVHGAKGCLGRIYSRSLLLPFSPEFLRLVLIISS